MNSLQTRRDNPTAGQRLDEGSCFEPMAGQLIRHSHFSASFAALARDSRTHEIDAPVASAQTLEDCGWSRIRRTGFNVSSPSDIGYFRVRAANELTAAGRATDKRVRRVHLEMAKRYHALISKAGRDIPARLHAVAN
jgi:hypothetical protein